MTDNIIQIALIGSQRWLIKTELSAASHIFRTNQIRMLPTPLIDIILIKSRLVHRLPNDG